MLAFESYSCFIMKSSRSEQLLFNVCYECLNLTKTLSSSTSFWLSDDSEIKRSGVELTSVNFLGFWEHKNVLKRLKVL